MIEPEIPDCWVEYLRGIRAGLVCALMIVVLGVKLQFGPPKHRRWKRRGPIEEPEHLLYIDRQKSF